MVQITLRFSHQENEHVPLEKVIICPAGKRSAHNNIRRKDLQPSHARTVDWCFLRGGPMSDGGAGVLC